jgi:flagellar basal-body rod protein FlgC
VDLFGVMQISSSALTAERYRAEIAAANMANAETTRTPEGGPYRRRQVVFGPASKPFQKLAEGFAGQGVEAKQVVVDNTPPLRRYDPSHPDADAEGYVSYPAIDPVSEMADLMDAMRAYELNASAVNATKQMIGETIDILR